MARHLAEKEKGADTFVVELASLLHDIADWKFHAGDESLGPKVAQQWLKKQKVDEKITKRVVEVIKNVSFMGAGVKPSLKTIEGKIVHDADKLDALGAMGIARTFAYGGYMGHVIHDPEYKPILHKTAEEYKAAHSPTIAHFYEKLLLLKNRMQTETGKKIARERHRFMEKYLKQFFTEWEGER